MSCGDNLNYSDSDYVMLNTYLPKSGYELDMVPTNVVWYYWSHIHVIEMDFAKKCVLVLHISFQSMRWSRPIQLTS